MFESVPNRQFVTPQKMPTIYRNLLFLKEDCGEVCDTSDNFVKKPGKYFDVIKKEFEWDFGVTEYKALFDKTRESMACGPSGLHMSHCVAACEDKAIAEVHAFFIWSAFALGFSYQRWQVSYHCMIQKLSQPYIHKLRIVQLFEGDFNGGLKYLLGKVFMRHLVQNKAITGSAFGSIPGRDAQEAMQLLQFTYENHRIQKRDLIAMFNDAAGCYDRIRPNQADLCKRRLKCPDSISTCHMLGLLFFVQLDLIFVD